MDLMFFVNKRLEQVNFFYDNAVPVFEEIKRKIEAGEKPYSHSAWEGDPEEQPFMEEWSRANTAIDMAGGTCLDHVQSTFHQFLEQFMHEIGAKELVPRIKEMKKGSWFANYREFFLKELGIDWNASGADIDLLEQAVLTRNDFAHNFSFTTLAAFQTDFHAKKYPVTSFGDGMPRIINKRLTVQKEILDKTIAVLHRLCEYLDRERWEFLKRLRAARRTP